MKKYLYLLFASVLFLICSTQTYFPIFKKYQSYRHDERNAAKILSDLGSDTVLIFAYGSLISKRSSAMNLKPSTLDTFTPAVGFGIRRVFSRNVDSRLIEKRFGSIKSPLETGALNVKITSNDYDVVNGVLFRADVEELHSMIGREVGYDLIPISVAKWDEYLDFEHSLKKETAYVFVATEGVIDGVELVRDDILPIPGYALLCLEGAKDLGEEFLQYWLNTTFLSDETTSIGTWLEDQVILEMMAREK